MSLQLTPHSEAIRELEVLLIIRRTQEKEYRTHGQDHFADSSAARIKNIERSIKVLEKDAKEKTK